jgi:CheY-like chemotaxis protein/two-component sensor histidine kinase
MRILIVDDSAVMRGLLRRELERAGYEVFEAGDGQAAVDMAAEIGPDLVTMDVEMPNMNGYEAVFKIRSEKKLEAPGRHIPVPIIFITANDTLEGRRKGFEVGATQFITKPFVKGEIAAAAKALIQPDSRFADMTALVVEDSAMARSILINILESEGVHTIAAENGEQGFELMKAHDEAIDIVLTDFLMPKMNGDELCRRIRQEMRDHMPPVIVLSAMAEAGAVLQIFKSGASDYVVKPFAREELLARIKVHLEARLLNRKLARQVHELKRLNKLQNDFLAITSHDLRSPLNGVLGFAELLMMDTNLDDTQRHYLDNIVESGQFLLSLINDILDLGRVQSENHELVLQKLQVDRLLESSLSTIRHMATPKNIRIEYDNDGYDGVCISGNKGAILRIFNNLLSNAIKFTPKDGRVEVVQRIENDRVTIRVRDNGIGIPPAKIPLLFDKFSKVSRPGTAGEKSTGLGLVITRELVERLGGTIEVSSEEGVGTCFQVAFPLEDEGKADLLVGSESIGVRSPPVSDRQDIYLLLVDDNQLNLKLAATALEKRGFRFKCVSDGKAALDAYVEAVTQPEQQDRMFDFIFMDIDMPAMDGCEATERIRAFEEKMGVRTIPVIAMTAGTGEAWEERGRAVGMNGFLTKPLQIDKIEKIVHQFIYIDKH